MNIPAGNRGDLSRRLLALAAAAATLWAALVTARSDTVSSAAAALRREASSPLTVLRWELGDLWENDSLSAAAALTIGESPLLLSARQEVAKLWSQETADASAPAASGSAEPSPAVTTTPVTETPLAAAPTQTDNGIPARTLVPSGGDGYTQVGKVCISNSTKHTLSPSALQETFSAELGGDGPQLLILHTHGSEAYTPPKGTDIKYSGNLRTTDSRYNVVHVGDVMSQAFSAAGISVIHDRTLYDYPSYAGSYDRSLAAIRSYLAQYPSIRFILDVHRDAIEDAKGTEYKVISQEKDVGAAAQMTLVVGSDGSGMAHPKWMENLKLAVSLQQYILNTHPTLMRPILLRNSRYNQHATTGSLLVEVGAAGNSPEEAARAGKLLAQEMAQLLQDRSK